MGRFLKLIEWENWSRTSKLWFIICVIAIPISWAVVILSVGIGAVTIWLCTTIVIIFCVRWLLEFVERWE